MGCHPFLCLCPFPWLCHLFQYFISSLSPIHASPFRPNSTRFGNDGGLLDYEIHQPCLLAHLLSCLLEIEAGPNHHATQSSMSLYGNESDWTSFSIPLGFHRSWMQARSVPRLCGTSLPWIWSMQWKVSNTETIISCLGVCVRVWVCVRVRVCVCMKEWMRPEDEWCTLIVGEE